jgi:hypothetical protein
MEASFRSETRRETLSQNTQIGIHSRRIQSYHDELINGDNLSIDEFFSI